MRSSCTIRRHVSVVHCCRLLLLLLHLHLPVGLLPLHEFLTLLDLLQYRPRLHHLGIGVGDALSLHGLVLLVHLLYLLLGHTLGQYALTLAAHGRVGALLLRHALLGRLNGGHLVRCRLGISRTSL